MMPFKRLLFCSKRGFAKLTPNYYTSLESQYGCHNYHPLPVVLERGQGIYVWDVQGKKYFDCLAAYSSVNQGHVHPKIYETLIEQAKLLTLSSRAVYNNKLGLVQKKLHEVFGYDKALLMNSGVEAGQSAIKFSRRWGYQVKKIPQNSATVLFAKGNFWGRTIAACGSSEDPDRYRNFGPYGGLNFELIDYGCLQSLQSKLKENPNIVAYMVEPIQGEKGVIIPKNGYLKAVSALLKKYNVLLICDEIQTGLGRTGKLLCSQHQNVRPDIVLLGKALSGGFYPVSAVLCDNQIMNLIKPGQHGSTYGGNPLASALAMTSLKVLLQQKMIENSAKLGKKFLKNLKEIFDSDRVKQVRGKGLFIGVEFQDKQRDAYQFSLKMLENGVIAKPTQKNIIRYSPPLIINQIQLQTLCGQIERSWNQFHRSNKKHDQIHN